MFLLIGHSQMCRVRLGDRYQLLQHSCCLVLERARLSEQPGDTEEGLQLLRAQAQLILGSFPPGELQKPLMKALDHPGARHSVPRIVGATGDSGLSAILAPHAASEDEDFLLAVGDALVRCRNAVGIPALVSCLKSHERATRFIAITLLKGLTQGKDFGFRPGRSATENAAATKVWEEWAEKFGKTIFDK